MKYGFVSFDVGPSKYNTLVASVLARMGHEVVLVPPQMKNLVGEYRERLLTCDVVILGGPASFAGIDEEITLVESLPLRIPIVVLEDTPGSSGRPKFHRLSERVHTVIVAAEDSKTPATSFGYVEPRYLGLPQHWKAGYDTLVSAKNKRGEFTKTCGDLAFETLSVKTDDFIVFYGCIKDGGMNNQILSLMHMAMAVGRENMVVAFKTRNDETISPEQQAERDCILQDAALWHLEFGDASMPEIMNAANISVFSGGATDSIMCALAGKPAIYCTSDAVRKRNELQGIPNGGEWFVAKFGGALVVDMDEGPHVFVAAVKQLLTPEGQRTLRENQARNFPVPLSVWETDVKVARFLENLGYYFQE